MSKIFDSQGNKIGDLDGGIFGGKFSGRLYGQDGSVIGEVSTGGIFDPSPEGFPGDQTIFDAQGHRIGHFSQSANPFGDTYPGIVYDQKGHQIGKRSNFPAQRSSSVWPGSAMGAVLIFLLIAFFSAASSTPSMSPEMVNAIATAILSAGVIAAVILLWRRPSLTIFILLYGVIITASFGFTAKFLGTSLIACVPIIAFPIVYFGLISRFRKR